MTNEELSLEISRNLDAKLKPIIFAAYEAINTQAELIKHVRETGQFSVANGAIFLELAKIAEGSVNKFRALTGDPKKAEEPKGTIKINLDRTVATTKDLLMSTTEVENWWCNLLVAIVNDFSVNRSELENNTMEVNVTIQSDIYDNSEESIKQLWNKLKTVVQKFASDYNLNFVIARGDSEYTIAPGPTM